VKLVHIVGFITKMLGLVSLVIKGVHGKKCNITYHLSGVCNAVYNTELIDLQLAKEELFFLILETMQKIAVFENLLLRSYRIRSVYW
jgi:hypothetical protein